jgi:hypothetical protein
MMKAADASTRPHGLANLAPVACGMEWLEWMRSCTFWALPGIRRPFPLPKKNPDFQLEKSGYLRRSKHV